MMDLIPVIKKINLVKYFLTSSIIITLSACQTAPQQEKSVSTQPIEVEKPIDEVSLDQEQTAEQLLMEAEDASNEQAIVLLLQASQKFILQQQLEQSLHISEELSKLPLTNQQKQYNQVNIAQTLYEIGAFDLAEQELEKATETTVSKRHALLAANIDIQQQKLVEGIIGMLEYYQIYPATNIDDIKELGDHFAKLTPWQLNALTKKSAFNLEGWLSFTNIVSENASDITVLNEKLSAWQRDNLQHPASYLIEDIQTQGVAEQLPINHIAVLIPLSGKEQVLGKTIQAGIIAAYQKQTDREIEFFDTNADDMESIVSKLQLSQPDFVIGPLLKDHVDEYLATNIFDEANDLLQGSEPVDPNNEFEPSFIDEYESDIESENEDSLTEVEFTAKLHTWQTLLLNLPDEGTISENQYALSMLPEDEATQAAFTLTQKGYKNALVLTQNSSIGKRMATSFVKQWQLQNDVEPTIMYYPTNSKMGGAVKRGLDVNLSDERIYLMRNRIKENVKSEARNRQDIDMIYIIADPDQARLLKPYIDVNISPFANAIPIYASSRSYSQGSDRNTRRDLNGLTFTDIPWVLNGKPENKDLSAEAKVLWPNRSSTLERIYAMGIDSWQLIDKVTLMQQLPMLKHKGEIGILQMNNNGVISRSLSWARYRSSRVQSIVVQ